jgi:ATP-binding cassette subfamily B protein
MFDIAEELLQGHFGNVSRNIGTIGNFFKFLDVPERNASATKMDTTLGISTENVSFQYPESNHPSLSKINLNITSGETVALVGANGAGKTTLVKLLMGIYTPTSGHVWIGGVDTRTSPAQICNNNMSAVFQNYQRYKLTLADNICISDYDAENDNAFISDAMEKAECQIDPDKLPSGLSTMLSRDFDGVDLSGGEWQRVAIARGFYRKHQLIFLDEPTAAIDPVEETKLYKTFAQIVKDKTAVIVTHRLGSAKLADRIVVMDGGQIVEQGTHDELMNLPGQYAKMYFEQAKWYKK